MGRECGEQTSPDVFSTDTGRDASPLPPKPLAAEAIAEPAPQRHILPKNLRNAVKQLSDGELDELCEVAFDEAKRRRRLRWSIGLDSKSSSQRPPDLPTKRSPPPGNTKRIAEASLTRGQVNAVRAAFKAGITPASIARQFGILQSNVSKALAADEPKR